MKDFGGFGEKEACELLNSARMTHPWKKDFDKNQEPHEDWDLINSEGVKIEVKSTSSLVTFRYTSVTLSTPGQAKQIILKVLLGGQGEICDYKFVRKLRTRWVNITDEVCASVSSSRKRAQNGRALPGNFNRRRATAASQRSNSSVSKSAG